jgi:hypothetical protein
MPGWQQSRAPSTRAPMESLSFPTPRMLTLMVKKVAELLLGMSKRMSPLSPWPNPRPHVMLPLPPYTSSSGGLSHLPYWPPRPRTLDHLLGPSLLVKVTHLGKKGPDFCLPPSDRPASGSQLVSSPCNFSTLTLQNWSQLLDPLALKFVLPALDYMLSQENLDWLLADSGSEWKWSASLDKAGPDNIVA